MVTALSLVLSASAQPMPVVASSPDRLVLAFYYNWFGPNDWQPGKLVDAPKAPYTSSDRGVMGRHIDQAKAAGIDALLVNWYGPATQNNQTETNLGPMLDEAAARGFRLAVDVDMNSPQFGSAAALRSALTALLSGHAKHPAYLRSGGKPVIFFYHQSARFSTDTWAGIRAAVDPNHTSLWIEEGTDVSPLSVFDGHHLYSVTWQNRTDMGYTAQKFARWVRDAAGRLGTPKIYVATVMPGYDDRKAPGRSGTFAVGREDGAYYERSWQGAIGAAPDWIVINSFNEWYEGDTIEPSQAYGNRYLELTSVWSAAFHSSSPPPVAAAAAATVAPTAIAAPATVPAATLAPVPTRRPQPPVPTPTPAPPPERPVRMGPHGPWAL
jgi:Glycosyl hydrolase family 99